MNKGDIVLVPFPFTDLTGNKNRPAVILNVSEEDVLVCFITTQVKWKTEYDIFVKPTVLNGLKKPSVIRLNKLTTLDKELILGRLGVLDNHYIGLLNKNLIRLFVTNQSEVRRPKSEVRTDRFLPNNISKKLKFIIILLLLMVEWISVQHSLLICCCFS